MELNQLLSQYQGRKLQLEEMSSYENWSLNFFHQREYVHEPNLQMTLQLNVTQALQHSRQTYRHLPDASFTAYLTWHLMQTCKAHPCFRYRCIEGQWYIFDNLPVFTPVAVGGDARFAEVLIENGAGQLLEDFFANYRSCLKQGKEQTTHKALSNIVWGNALFVGNLPNLQFTGFTLHTPTQNTGRPMFYFGKRYEQAGQVYIPLLITFDHSNLDPYVLSAFMGDFEQSIAGEPVAVGS